LNKVSKNNNPIKQLTFFFLVLSVISVPLLFWAEFDSKFDLIKASVLFTTGGLFIIFSCIYYIKEINMGKLQGNFRLLKSPDLLILIFLLSVIVSSVFSGNIYVSFFGSYSRQIGLLLFLYLVVIYFLSDSFINGGKKINNIVSAMEIMALITSLYTITGYLGYNIFNVTPVDSLRPYSNIGNPVFSAGFITLVFPASLLNINGKKNIVAAIIIPLIMLLGIVFSFTRTAYIAVLAEILLVLFLLPFINKKKISNYKKYYAYTASYSVVIIICILAYAFLFPENVFAKRILSISNLTNLPRWYLWGDSIKMFFDYPLLGTGPGLFSNVFEKYASYQLKFAEIKGFFDNPHNNFLNFFCTLGVFGGLSYLLILMTVILKAGKFVISKKTDLKAKPFFLFILCSFSGYFIYSLADFDEISILFYLFILLSVFKSKYLNTNKYLPKVSRIRITKKAGYAFFVLLITFSAYNIYSSVYRVSAQNSYCIGLNYYNSGRFNESINYFNKAISEDPEQSQYRFELGFNIIKYCTDNNQISTKTREYWLKKAKEEFSKAKDNYPYPVYCLTYLSLIELEEGNEAEANKIKNEIFTIDTFQFAYRLNLASYYLKHNKDKEAIKEINLVLNYDIKNTDAMCEKVIYLKQEEKYGEAIDVCKKILEINPEHKVAKSMIAWLKTRTNG
jgi:putative inorganic carbon (hco3(-)) transporter